MYLYSLFGVWVTISFLLNKKNDELLMLLSKMRKIMLKDIRIERMFHLFYETVRHGKCLVIVALFFWCLELQLTDMISAQRMWKLFSSIDLLFWWWLKPKQIPILSLYDSPRFFIKLSKKASKLKNSHFLRILSFPPNFLSLNHLFIIPFIKH